MTERSGLQYFKPSFAGNETLEQLPGRCQSRVVTLKNIGTRSGLSQACSVGPAKLQAPAADGLITHIDTAFSEGVFDIAKAQGKAEVKPDGIPNNLGWKTMTGVGSLLHPATTRKHWQPVTRSI